MKKSIIYIGILLLVISGCAGGGPVAVDKPASANVVQLQGADDEEYELTIIDPGFQRWFASYGRPITHYSPNYYADWNKSYVQQWNMLADRPLSGGVDYPFENRIDYRSDVDYGVQLNHELYWYFRYIESMYGQQYNFGFGRRNI